jgi:hypothetical protein
LLIFGTQISGVAKEKGSFYHFINFKNILYDILAKANLNYFIVLNGLKPIPIDVGTSDNYWDCWRNENVNNEIGFSQKTIPYLIYI